MRRFLSLLIVFILLFSLTPRVTYAADDTAAPLTWDNCFFDAKDANGVALGQVATLSCLPPLIENILKAATLFAGAVAVFFIVWGGYKLVRSGGDPKQVEGARQAITYAIIGLIIVFMSYFVITFIATLTGVDCIKKFGFDQCRTDNPTDSASTGSTDTCPSDTNFTAAQIPTDSCSCADGATNQFGECDTNGVSG